MPQENLMHQAWDQYDRSQDRLQKAIETLSTAGHQHLKKTYGLTGSLSEQSFTEESAMKLCEEAMACLAETFPQALERYQLANSPTEALAALEEAELVWQSAATIIQHFDADGQETAFLKEIRAQSLETLQAKLDSLGGQRTQFPQEERVAFILGTIAVMDMIMEELGYPVSDTHRQSFRKIARDLY